MARAKMTISKHHYETSTFVKLLDTELSEVLKRLL